MFENFNPQEHLSQSIEALRQSDAYKYLNAQQFAAATYPLSSFLVLAGAGSGKTSVLIKRLRYLIETIGLHGKDIMAVTFTNKAAGEIRSRAYGELNRIQKANEVNDMTIGTFHSICLRMMKEFNEYLPLNAKESEIIDSDARELLILRLMEMGYLPSSSDQSTYLRASQRIQRLLLNIEHEISQFEYKISDEQSGEKNQERLSALNLGLNKLKDCKYQVSLLLDFVGGEKKSTKVNLLGDTAKTNVNIVSGILSAIDAFKESGYRHNNLSSASKYKHYFATEKIGNLTVPSITLRYMSEQDYYNYLAIFLYQEYEKYLLDHNMLDFSDLLISMVEVFSNNEEARNIVRNRYKVVMVDEFQDTNTLQYRWLKLVSGDNTSVMIVGDDDQSIYGWRGGHPEYMRYFLTDFKKPLATGLELPSQAYYEERLAQVGEVEMIKLEQNYRSTYHILSVANNAIKFNQNRLDKTLFTKRDPSQAETVKVVSFSHPTLQATWVANDILAQIERTKNTPEPLTFKDFAVIYRNNSSSNAIDRAFVRHNIPHIIYGGYNFYKRKEIRDALVWLNFALNPENDLYFEMVCNQIPMTKRPNPSASLDGAKRGFEPKMIDFVKKESKRTSCNHVLAMYNIAVRFNKELQGESSPNSVMRNGQYAEFLNDKTSMKIGQSCLDFARFLGYVFEPLSSASSLHECVELILKRSQNLQYHQALLDAEIAKEKNERGTSRKTTNANKIQDLQRYIENVNAFIQGASEYQNTTEEYAQMSIAEKLREWLQEISLLTDKENAAKTERVTMMTVHSSKGLEFNRVYLIDMNDRVFSSTSSDEPEEEMRLFYVAVTRAKSELVISSSGGISDYLDMTLSFNQHTQDFGCFSGYTIDNLKTISNPNGEFSLREHSLDRGLLGKILYKDREAIENAKITEKPPKFQNYHKAQSQWQGVRSQNTAEAGSSMEDFKQIFDLNY